MDSRKKRDGRAIEEVGLYHPKEEPSLIKVDSDRVQYWLGVGAQPTDAVLAILKITGDWQKFKGLPGQEGTLKVAEPRVNRAEAFDQAIADSEVAKKEPKLNIVAKTEPVEEVVEEPAAEAVADETAVEDASAEDAAATEEPAAESKDD